MTIQLPVDTDSAYAKQMIPLETNHVKTGIFKQLSAAKKLAGIFVDRAPLQG
jgi:hypothetical protein